MDPSVRRFTTGEFAALCGVTKHTLFHYDQVGVFSPAEKGENGYRYYAPEQIEVFHVITALKEMGMSLEEIRLYLDRRSPGELVALLERQRAEVDRRLARLRQLRRHMAEKAELTRRAMAARPGVVEQVWWPERRYVVTAASHLTDSARFAALLAAHLKYCQAHGVDSPHAMGALLPVEAARREDWDGYTHCYTQVERRCRGAALLTAPAGTYLSYCHAGSFETVAEGYRQVLAWADGHGLTLGPWFLEDVLLDQLSGRGPDQYLIRLSVPVKD